MFDLTKTEEVNKIVRESLRGEFPFYKEGHFVKNFLISSSNLWIRYETIKGNPLEVRGSTHFDLNIISQICYLNHIQLEESLRGKGNGWKLYQAVHRLSRNLGLNRVIQTPSGGFFSNGVLVRTRLDYLLQRGYKMCNDVEVELVL